MWCLGSAVHQRHLPSSGASRLAAIPWKTTGPHVSLHAREVSTCAYVPALSILPLKLGNRNPPELLRSSTAQRASQSARAAIDRLGAVQPVQVSASSPVQISRAQNTLLVPAYVQSSLDDQEHVRQLTVSAIKRELTSRYDAPPLVHVTVLQP